MLKHPAVILHELAHSYHDQVLGFDEPRSVGLSSSRGALPIWRRFVEGATGGAVRGAFLRPPEIERVAIDPELSARLGAAASGRAPEFGVARTVAEIEATYERVARRVPVAEEEPAAMIQAEVEAPLLAPPLADHG